MTTLPKEMTAEKLVKIYSDLEALGITPILDGGWGVDALLGEQTRPHKDIDFLVEQKHVETLKQYLDENGFKPSETEDSTWYHMVYENEDAVVDAHVIELMENGDGSYGPKEWNAFFPAYSLIGEGTINGKQVRCLTAEYRVICLTTDYGVVVRTGYKLNDKDHSDIKKLCDKFGIEMPEEFKEYWTKKQ